MATKQQIAQAKARAGGNNPIKVTNKGLKKLGGAALIAASFTPAGRVARGAATVAKAAKAEGIMAKAGWNTAAKANYRAQVKRETDAIAKNSVKVKPAKKTVGNPPNMTKANEGMYSSASRGGVGKGPLGKAKDARVATSKKPTADTARAAALRAETNKALARSAKGKTQTPTAEAARRRNLNK